MRYLKSYEAKINSNKHTIEEYADNPEPIDNSEWSKYSSKSSISKILELTYIGDNKWFEDIRDFNVVLDVTIGSKMINRTICINVHVGEYDGFSKCFSNSNMKKFDINEFLEESIRYVENYSSFTEQQKQDLTRLFGEVHFIIRDRIDIIRVREMRESLKESARRRAKGGY